MIIAVLDTNVLASGLVSGAASPGHILDAWEAGRFRIALSDHILSELDRTLSKAYFQRRYAENQVAGGRVLLLRQTELTEITVLVHGVATHPEDDRVLETAISAGADYLVTGDAALLRLGHYQSVALISPRHFAELLEREHEGGESETSDTD